MISTLVGSSCRPICVITRADIGKAEMPQAPIIGLILFFRNRFRSLANRTPPTVSKTKATRPRSRIKIVCTFRKFSARICEATVIPRRRVIRFASVPCAVSERLSRTPHSRIRLPNIRKPTSATLLGAIRPATIVMQTGNRIRAVLETLPP